MSDDRLMPIEDGQGHVVVIDPLVDLTSVAHTLGADEAVHALLGLDFTAEQHYLAAWAPVSGDRKAWSAMKIVPAIAEAVSAEQDAGISVTLLRELLRDLDRRRRP